MHPHVRLRDDLVAANYHHWRRHLGVPVWAVVKANGYGWGVRRMVEALDADCEGYCVADADELFDLRELTSRPIRLLGNVAPRQLADVLRARGIPTISTIAEVEALLDAAPSGDVVVRVGVRSALGWSGLEPQDIGPLAAALAASGFAVEVWTHLTHPSFYQMQRERFAKAVEMLKRVGVKVVSEDVAGTASAGALGACGGPARIGVGLFGGGTLPGLRCAIALQAPVVRLEQVRGGARVGYGEMTVPGDGYVLTARCGYADGLPRGLAGNADILSVGMQYLTMQVPHANARATITLLDETTSLDEFAARAQCSVHEVVTSLGVAHECRQQR